MHYVICTQFRMQFIKHKHCLITPQHQNCINTLANVMHTSLCNFKHFPQFSKRQRIKNYGWMGTITCHPLNEKSTFLYQNKKHKILRQLFLTQEDGKTKR